MIGIIGAMSKEVQGLKELMQNVTVTEKWGMQYERRLLVVEPPPAIHCRYCKIMWVISDTADDDSAVDYPAFEEQAIEHLVRLTNEIIKNIRK